jgi:hypothetical protein
MALAKSKRNGPNGDDQIKLTPTEERTLSESATQIEDGPCVLFASLGHGLPAL